MSSDDSSREHRKGGKFQAEKGFSELDDLNNEMKDLESGETCELYLEWGEVSGVAALLGSNIETGLTDFGEDRIMEFGENILPESPRESFLDLLLGAAQDVAVLILIAAAVVSLIVAGIEMATTTEEEVEPSWIEGTAIIVAVLIVTFVTAINDYQKENQFRSLSKAEGDIPISVRRNGKEIQVSILHLLVGDVVLLHTGDAIPADGIYIKGYDLYLDTSAMTGETVDIHKGVKDPYLLSGCKVTSGVGEMLVTAVGPHSEWGKTVAKLQTEAEETPLQEKLEGLVILIGYVGLAFAIATFIVLAIYWFIHYVFIDDPQTITLPVMLELLDALIIAITIVVVAVPEGLPLAVTISLAYSVSQMMEDNNLVRHLSACETMGGATNICSDKTGTLTENRMTVVRGYFGGLEFQSKEEIRDFKKAVSKDKEFKTLLRECISLNSDGNYEELEDGTLDFVGNKTECGLLVFNDKIGDNTYADIRSEHTKYQIIAFSSLRKRMSTVVPVPEPSAKVIAKWQEKTGEGDAFIDPKQDFRIYSKGAPEVLIEYCSYLRDADGVRALEQQDIDFIIESQESMARKGLRTLLLAYRDVPAGTEWKKAEDLENNLVVLGLAGIEDPLREGVKNAVRSCQRAGIFVRMVTGDNILTAKKIAEDCGILTAGGIAITGPEMRSLTPQQLDDILPRLQVVARSSPTDKYILVSRLRQNGEVVSVTGDGTNDAPALKEADVGLSMGIAGTQVAKEASDIVIVDDNFNSIVRSVVWGRSVYDNIRKFIQFQLTINVVALLTAFLAALFQFGTPLTAVQLLWVNLIMDTMAALALGTEKPTDQLLLRRPYGRDSGLISNLMYKNIIVQSVYQLALLLAMLLATDANTGYHLFFPSIDSGKFYEGRPSAHYTLIFNVFVFCQVFNEFNSRKCDRSMNVFSGLFKNVIFVGVIIVTVAVQFLVVQFGGNFSKCVALDFGQWMTSICLGFFSLIVGYFSRVALNPLVPVEEWELPAGDVIRKRVDA